MKSYSLSDISPSRIRNRRDDVALDPYYRLCYATEQYIPKIGYLQKLEDNQRVTYTYTGSADAVGLISV
jgi:hypothetical protein